MTHQQVTCKICRWLSRDGVNNAVLTESEGPKAQYYKIIWNKAAFSHASIRTNRKKRDFIFNKRRSKLERKKISANFVKSAKICACITRSRLSQSSSRHVRLRMHQNESSRHDIITSAQRHLPPHDLPLCRVWRAELEMRKRLWGRCSSGSRLADRCGRRA